MRCVRTCACVCVLKSMICGRRDDRLCASLRSVYTAALCVYTEAQYSHHAQTAPVSDTVDKARRSIHSLFRVSGTIRSAVVPRPPAPHTQTQPGARCQPALVVYVTDFSVFTRRLAGGRRKRADSPHSAIRRQSGILVNEPAGYPFLFVFDIEITGMVKNPLQQIPA